MPAYLPRQHTYLVFVPRCDVGGTRTHVRVTLTLVQDRMDLDIRTSPVLEYATSVLTTWTVLPDKCEVTLTVTDLLLHLLEEQEKMKEGNKV